MKKTLIALGILVVLAITAVSANIAIAKQLPQIRNVEKTMFKNLVQSYLHPSINGWGIGLNSASDTYLVAKFHVVSVKTLPRAQIAQIIRDAKAGNATEWSEVRDKIKASIDANSTTVIKGRIQINKQQYVLTDIINAETTFSANIRDKPDYSACTATNISAETCELQSAKVGDLSLTMKTAELEENKQRLWAGTMNFNSTSYTFVALVNPRIGD